MERVNVKTQVCISKRKENENIQRSSTPTQLEIFIGLYCMCHWACT